MTTSPSPIRRKRKQPTKDEKLAAALLRVLQLEGRPIDRETAKTMTAKQLIGLFDCDHYPIPVALGGSNHPTNLDFKLSEEHAEKTAKIDIPTIAKSKRIEKKHTEFRERLLARQTGEEVEPPKRKAKIQSRNTLSREARQQAKEWMESRR